MEKLIFTADDGEEIEFEIIADTRISGVNYLLVANGDGDDGDEALILKDISKDSDEESEYVILEDEKELLAVAKVFEEDTDIELE